MSKDRSADPPGPTINVFLASLSLVALYLISTVVATFALAAADGALHPATRWFIWLVLTTAVGFNLLRRHRRYPSPAVLALILALSIAILLAMSIAAVLRLADGSGELAPQLLSFAGNAAALFVLGASGLYLAQFLFNRRSRAP